MKRIIVVALLLAVHLFLFTTPGQCQGIDVYTGEIDGAPFRIQIPARWNHCLVMYTHGYLPRGYPWSPMPDARSAPFLERGFAIAESGYSRQGWAVEEAIPETAALRRYFAKQYGEPDSTFITGHSMGGLLALATIEEYPDSYNGALPQCGPLVPAIVFFRDHAFDLLVTFEALFGDSLPADFRPVVEAAALPPNVVGRALESNPEKTDRFALHWDIRPEDLPGMVAFFHLFYLELADRAEGNPIDNRNTVYSGFGPIREFNGSVPRYAADSEAIEYARRHYTPTGLIEDPVLAIHTTYDPGVPPHFANYYEITVTLQGNEAWFVQQYVEAGGHCNIAPDLAGQAFDQLRTWAATGRPPEAGALRDGVSE